MHSMSISTDLTPSPFSNFPFTVLLYSCQFLQPQQRRIERGKSRNISAFWVKTLAEYIAFLAQFRTKRDCYFDWPRTLIGEMIPSPNSLLFSLSGLNTTTNIYVQPFEGHK